jgi:hypothetical protein
MPSTDTIYVLNRVLAILERSLPQYLRYSRPYVPQGREIVMQTVDQIVAGQNALAERVSQRVFESGGQPDHGEFPIEFADMHDLEIDYLLQEAIDGLKQDIADLDGCVAALRLAPAAQSLAAEAAGMTKGHLERLQSIAKSPVSSTKFGATPAFSNDMPAGK